jgi:hypothetical protein
VFFSRALCPTNGCAHVGAEPLLMSSRRETGSQLPRTVGERAESKPADKMRCCCWQPAGTKSLFCRSNWPSGLWIDVGYPRGGCVSTRCPNLPGISMDARPIACVPTARSTDCFLPVLASRFSEGRKTGEAAKGKWQSDFPGGKGVVGSLENGATALPRHFPKMGASRRTHALSST